MPFLHLTWSFLQATYQTQAQSKIMYMSPAWKPYNQYDIIALEMSKGTVILTYLLMNSD